MIEAADQSTDDAFYPLQWDKQNTNAATAQETATGAGTTLAIVDTGIDVDHPDLVDNVNAERGCCSSTGPPTPDEQDVYGHGSHVAGIAAASNDGTQGVVGMAPDAELISLRVFWYEDIDGDGEPDLVTTPATSCRRSTTRPISVQMRRTCPSGPTPSRRR